MKKVTFTRAMWRHLGKQSFIKFQNSLIIIRNEDCGGFLDINSPITFKNLWKYNLMIGTHRAYATKVYISSTFPDIATREDYIIVIPRDTYDRLSFSEFIGVLAHEITHITEKHLERGTDDITVDDEIVCDNYAVSVVGKEVFLAALFQAATDIPFPKKFKLGRFIRPWMIKGTNPEGDKRLQNIIR